jgi:hypothetical protein|tara:strand:- start:525 stop:659 length:135 start_codon:yes stop_codon:yes gene_type:complete
MEHEVARNQGNDIVNEAFIQIFLADPLEVSNWPVIVINIFGDET